jgi:hypothetical protein
MRRQKILELVRAAVSPRLNVVGNSWVLNRERFTAEVAAGGAGPDLRCVPGVAAGSLRRFRMLAASAGWAGPAADRACLQDCHDLGLKPHPGGKLTGGVARWVPGGRHDPSRPIGGYLKTAGVMLLSRISVYVPARGWGSGERHGPKDVRSRSPGVPRCGVRSTRSSARPSPRKAPRSKQASSARAWRSRS